MRQPAARRRRGPGSGAAAGPGPPRPPGRSRPGDVPVEPDPVGAVGVHAETAGARDTGQLTRTAALGDAEVLGVPVLTVGGGRVDEDESALERVERARERV